MTRKSRVYMTSRDPPQCNPFGVFFILSNYDRPTKISLSESIYKYDRDYNKYNFKIIIHFYHFSFGNKKGQEKRYKILNSPEPMQNNNVRGNILGNENCRKT